MERFVQYLDDLDDLFGAIGLLAERLRKLALLTALTIILASAAGGSVLLALAEPPLALALAILLFVTLLYRSVTEPGEASRTRYDTA